ncbi:MAG: hypothetical protein ACKO7R_02050 [Pseudanabaena sp.]
MYSNLLPRRERGTNKVITLSTYRTPWNITAAGSTAGINLVQVPSSCKYNPIKTLGAKITRASTG